MRRLIALALPPGPSFADELRRVLDDGDAALPLDLRLGDATRERVLGAMRPAALVDGSGERRPLEGAEPVEEGDALVMATSGTTGEPKGVVLTHGAVAASGRATSARIGVEPRSDRWWACLPLAHIGGLSVLLRSWETGTGCEVGAFSPDAAAAAVERGATLTSLVPTALARLDPELVAAFRVVVLGGQAPPEELPPNAVTTYGMTETGSGVVYDGRPLDGVEVAIGPGSEIMLRGPMLLRAYRDGTDPKTSEGWLPTGDAGFLDGAGHLRVDGRIADMVVTGGENVWPGPVEQVIERHPAVREAAVAGVADPEWGERVTAWLVLDGPRRRTGRRGWLDGRPTRGGAHEDLEPAALLAELRDLVREELAPFAAPRGLVIVDQIPRTPLGKVQRSALGDLEGPSASV